MNSQAFFSLTPDRVLEAIEQSGQKTSGLAYALNSLENRVYEVELEDRTRRIVKFYRPGRWSRETILDEHRVLAALIEAEIPVAAPLPIGSSTLAQTREAIFFAIFPKVGGRNPDELTDSQYEQLGRLLGRIHNVTATLGLKHRPTLSPETYGTQCLKTIVDSGHLGPSVAAAYEQAVVSLVQASAPLFAGVPTLPTHADCHRGNLLLGSEGWFFLDFDDMAFAPALQDIWLLLPSRPEDCPQEFAAFVRGYRQFRDLARPDVRLVEALRGLRYVRYASWVASRYGDPSFTRAFEEFGTDSYWMRQTADIVEQIRRMKQTPAYGLSA